MNQTEVAVNYFLTEDSLIDEEDISLDVLHAASEYLSKKFELDLDTRIGLKVCDDKEMSALHNHYMEDPETTDVMAFPSDDEAYLGDIIVCRDVAAREAKEREHDVRSELQYYVLHGFLHLLGFEDHTAAGKKQMLDLQSEALAHLGIEIQS